MFSVNLPPDWHADAACNKSTEHPDAWFPEPGHGQRMRTAAKPAQQVCQGCPVRVECRLAADENDEKWGVWGGEIREERWRRRWGA